MPRVDSSSCFGRILDWQNGGYCSIAPDGPCRSERQYAGQSLILQTTFRTERGVIRLSDCFTMHQGGRQQPHRQILRLIEGLEGEVACRCVLEPRFDYGEVRPWIRQLNANLFTALGGSSGLLISGDLSFDVLDGHRCSAEFTVRSGERVRLSIIHRRPETLDREVRDVPGNADLDRRLAETAQWWRDWSAKGHYGGQYAEHAHRSAIVLKGLCNAPTGGISASPTTSLPEEIGRVRNWDYRFSWIRDSVFTLRSLRELGYHEESEGFRRFIERSSAGSADELQIMYGVGGERKLNESVLGKLEGYRGTRPVRIGNDAFKQVQLDVYGELLELTWQRHQIQSTMDDHYWQFITELVERAIALWQKPDCGFWEFRDHQRHFVFSKAMCWVAVDRALKLAEDMGRDSPRERWQHTRSEMRERIMTEGIDPKRGVFIQSFDHPVSDSSLLLLPVFGFVDFKDELMVRTTDAIRADLDEDGLIRRYPGVSDGLPGNEGVFIACTFWLVECLAAQGRLDLAQQYYRRAVGTSNDLGLFSEEYDVDRHDMLGNFPQALTHLSHITALVALARAGTDSSE